MADQVNPPEKTPEEIEREMLSTRESLTNKVAALETQVVGTVQTAADTLTSTVESVKSLVSSAPETVSETVKQATSAVSDSLKGAFDISSRVRENPLAAVGVSVLLGGIVGAMLGGGRRGAGGSFSPFADAGAMPAAATPGYGAAQPAAPSRPGLMDDFMRMIGGKVKELAETALNSLSQSAKSAVETTVPKLVDEAASRLTAERDTEAESPTLAARFDARRTTGS